MKGPKLPEPEPEPAEVAINRLRCFAGDRWCQHEPTCVELEEFSNALEKSADESPAVAGIALHKLKQLAQLRALDKLYKPSEPRDDK